MACAACTGGERPLEGDVPERAASEREPLLVDYLVFEIAGGQTARLLSHQLVQVAALPASLTEKELVQPTGPSAQGMLSVPVRLRDAAGEVVYRARIRVPRWTRGEFHGEPAAGGGARIEGGPVPYTSRVFVVRVPAVSGARLELGDPVPGSFDLDTSRPDPRS